eukprot:TRINITY_DN16110_c0_g1_i2.p1 TRINITY_DN16110_c0_g1~~TRINITY_DN16110_c0_g1_i2.p1  ORF type:complete len:1144 (-),score=278.45 TRINITY_DN16110_c0_g1_i2:3083-6406(-)
MGGSLKVYHYLTGQLIHHSPIFPNGAGRIHGIKVLVLNGEEHLLIWGQKQIKLFRVSSPQFQLALEVGFPLLSDWIWDALAFAAQDTPSLHSSGLIICVGLAQNLLQLWLFQDKQLRFLKHIRGHERCLLYSMSIYFSKSEGLVVASGTIFNEILLWKPFISDQTFFKLVGHEGVIFRMFWGEDGKSLLSVSDDRSARLWDTPSFPDSPLTDPPHIPAIQSFYGHGARVWDCIIPHPNSPYIITCSEDTTIRVWDVATGTKISTLEGHTGKSVWRVALHPKGSILASGGGDSAVKLWNLQSLLHKEKKQLNEILFELPSRGTITKPKKQEVARFILASCSHLFIASTLGFVYRKAFDETKGAAVEEIHKDEGTTWQSGVYHHYNQMGGLLILGDSDGFITIISAETNAQFKTFKFQASPQRITTVIPFDIDEDYYSFGTSSANTGELILWRIGYSDQSGITSCSMVYTFALPSASVAIWSAAKLIFTKEIKSTDNTQKSEALLVLLGDSAGSIYLFEVPVPHKLNDEIAYKKQKTSFTTRSSTLSEKTEDKFYPVFHLKNLHASQRVCSIYISTEEVMGRQDHTILTGGRNGHICKLKFFVDELDHNVKLVKISDSKAYKNMDMVESIERCGENDIYFGFYGSNAVFYNLSKESKLLSLPCGGSKRPSAYFIDTTLSVPMIHFISSKQTQFSLYSVPSPTLKESLFSKAILQQPHHGRDNNSIQILKHLSTPQEVSIVTTSEDVTVRYSVINTSKLPETSITTQTLHNHTSAARATATTRHPSKPLLMFSGGSKLEMKAWGFNESGRFFYLISEINSTIPGINKKKNKKKQTSEKMINHRVMALVAFPVEGTEKLHCVISGRSDAMIEVLLFDDQELRWETIAHLNQGSCVLSLSDITTTERQHILFSGGTDGKIFAWDLTKLVQEIGRSHKEGTKIESAWSLQASHTFAAHQSGVDSISILPVAIQDHGDAFILCSGGDDQVIFISVFKVVSKEGSIVELGKKKFDSMHNGSIRGIWSTTLPYKTLPQVEKDRFWVFSIGGEDQLLSIWNIKFQKHNQILDFTLEFIQNRLIDVAHSTGMTGTMLDGNKVVLAICGQGIQVLQVST